MIEDLKDWLNHHPNETHAVSMDDNGLVVVSRLPEDDMFVIITSSDYQTQYHHLSTC